VETAQRGLADGAEKAGGTSSRVIEFCCARNRPEGEGKIRY
jgi:hypothetical protein